MDNKLKSYINRNFLFIYIFYSIVFIGWQLASFIYIYSSMDQVLITNRLLSVSFYQVYLIGIAILLTLLMVFLNGFVNSESAGFQILTRRQMILQSIYIAMIFTDYLLMKSTFHLQVIELIVFLLSLWVLKQWGSNFFNSKRPEWQHPTTYGSVFSSAVLSGCALLSIFHFNGVDHSRIHTIILILLVVEVLILYARFQYLSKASPHTNQIARKLFGSQILLFGLRIIVGIFMPAIFIIFRMIKNGEPVEGIGVLILIGTALDRYLFLDTDK